MLAFTRSTGRAVKLGGGHFAAAQLLDQVQGAGHAQLGGIFADALLVMGGSIRVLAKAAGGLADVIACKLGRFKQQLGGFRLDLAVQAAHNAGQGNRLFAIADDQVLGGQGKLLAVQRGDLLAVLGTAHNDLAAFQRVHIKGVHRLADFQHDIVGDIHHVGNAAQAAQGQLAAHPARRFTGGDVAHIVAQVARAQVRCFHRNAQARVLVIAHGVIGGRHFQGLVQHSGNFACNAQNALAVGTVGGDGDIKDIIIQPNNLLNGGSGHGIFGQVQQAVYLSAGVQVLVQTQFLAGAEHTVGFNAHQGLCLDLDASGQRGAVQSSGGVHTGVHIGRTGGDLNIMAIVAAVHLTDMQVGALLGHALGHNANNNLADLSAKVDEFFYFKATVE